MMTKYRTALSRVIPFYVDNALESKSERSEVDLVDHATGSCLAAAHAIEVEGISKRNRRFVTEDLVRSLVSAEVSSR